VPARVAIAALPESALAGRCGCGASAALDGQMASSLIVNLGLTKEFLESMDEVYVVNALSVLASKQPRIECFFELVSRHWEGLLATQ